MFGSGQIKKKNVGLMENLGEYLKEKRETLDITVEELASQTRIPIRYIKAIEEDRFDQLPNPVSAKGFLRSYAESVGVDFSVITESFAQYKPSGVPYDQTENQDNFLSYLHVRKSIRGPFPRKIVFSVVGVIAFLLVLVGLLSNNGRDVAFLSPSPLELEEAVEQGGPPVFSESPLFSGEEEGAGETPMAEADSSADVEDLLPQNESSAATNENHETLVARVDPSVPEDNIQGPPAPDLAQTPGEGPAAIIKTHTLFLEASEASWVQVTIDDSDVREALLQPQDTVKWTADKKFLLTLGNAGGVRVELDGRDLGPLGPSGEVVHKELLVDSSEQTE